MVKLRTLFCAIVVSATFAAHASACISSTGERTFLPYLNDETLETKFVALVEVTGLSSGYVCFPGTLTCSYVGVDVEVVVPIQGSTPKQKLIAAKSTSSCVNDGNLIPGQTHFVSGEVIEGVLWSGKEGVRAQKRAWKFAESPT